MASKEIPLTRGFVTIVDEGDYDWLNKWKWHCTPQGYASRSWHVPGSGRKNQKSVFIAMHRLIMNPPDGMHIDHINFDRLDNRRCNLRICSQADNNKHVKHRGKIAKYKGISKAGERWWQARIMANGQKFYLGCFNTQEEAAEAYNEAAKKYHREFARLNRI